jgi:hypothetical protein
MLFKPKRKGKRNEEVKYNAFSAVNDFAFRSFQHDSPIDSLINSIHPGPRIR